MKTIGLLGGTGWPSTMGYYKILNELVANRLGGYHSAKIFLKSIDYHDIKSNYSKNDVLVAELLKRELEELFSFKPDCVIICCNTLHKYLDIIIEELQTNIPIIHAIDTVRKYLLEKNYKNVLLLATKFTMEDGFFAKKIEKNGISVTIPNLEDRNKMALVHAELSNNIITKESQIYVANLIKKYQNLDAVIFGCTEYSLLANIENFVLPIIDPMYFQALAAVNYALNQL